MNENKSQITRRGFFGVVGIAGVGVGMGIGGGLGPRVEAGEARPVKRAEKRIIVGLDCGDANVRVILAEAQSGGTMRIMGRALAPSRGIREGRIVDAESAQDSITNALVKVETTYDVMIPSVYLGVTGACFSSFNNRGFVLIPENQEKITEHDCNNVRSNARVRPIPQQDMFLHSIPQNFYVDWQQTVLNTVGMPGRRLDADFHIIHGPRATIQNPVRCLMKIPVAVEDVVFNPLASATAVLDADQKKLGALVIDIGSGTTGYLVCVDGAVCQSGCVADGGRHISNEISETLSIPASSAERLKICVGRGPISYSAEDREKLTSIIHVRMRQILESVKSRLDISGVQLRLLGAGVQLTGGCSLVRGINELVGEIFGIPAHRALVKGVSGFTSVLEDPGYACAIGLAKFAHERIFG